MRQWAIAIGVDQYQNFQPLTCAQQDAQSLRDGLVREGAIAPAQCLLLTDTSPDRDGQSTRPTLAGIESWLAQLAQQVAPGDSIWCFFSGYGVAYQAQDYLMPLDGDPAAVATTGLSVQRLYQILQGSAAAAVLVLLDVNRSQGVLNGDHMGMATAQVASDAGIATILSCQPDQFSSEALALGQGFLTVALLEGLRGRRYRTLAELHRFLRDRLPELCEHHLRPEQNPFTICPPEKIHQIILPRTVAWDGPTTETVEVFPVEDFADFPTANFPSDFPRDDFSRNDFARNDFARDTFARDTFARDKFAPRDFSETSRLVQVLDPDGWQLGHPVGQVWLQHHEDADAETPPQPHWAQHHGRPKPPLQADANGRMTGRRRSHAPAMGGVLRAIDGDAVRAQVLQKWRQVRNEARLAVDKVDSADPAFGRSLWRWGSLAMLLLVAAMLARSCAPALRNAPATSANATANHAESRTTSLDQAEAMPAPGADTSKSLGAVSDRPGRPASDALTRVASAPKSGTDAAPPAAIASAGASTGAAAIAPTAAAASSAVAGASLVESARLKTLVKSEQASPYAAAIAAASKIPPHHAEHAQAQRAITTWSQDIYTIAQRRAQGKQFTSAILAAALVPQNQAIYGEARGAIATWCSNIDPELPRDRMAQKAAEICQQ